MLFKYNVDKNKFVAQLCVKADLQILAQESQGLKGEL